MQLIMMSLNFHYLFMLGKSQIQTSCIQAVVQKWRGEFFFILRATPNIVTKQHYKLTHQLTPKPFGFLLAP